MINITVTCPVYESFRVKQVAGMFDVPLSERLHERFRVEVPEDLLVQDGKAASGSPWKIGLIVGPSGSGKSTIAKEIFGDRLYRRSDWAADKAVVDGLGDRPIKEITGLFTAVGFSSPPSWIKPYQVLSGGEQFRCDLARALARGLSPFSQREKGDCPPCAADNGRTVVFDEFTSVVDRNVARVVSAAIAKGIRGGRIGCRFVAVTCHYDVAEWLQPDWILDMATATFQRRRLRRPPIKLEIFRCGRCAWRLFARHHYLSGSLSSFAQCYLAVWEGLPVAFCATLPLAGFANRRRISRLVTLPDYQGIGIGMTVAETVAEYNRRQGYRLNITASHPAVIAHGRCSPKWRAISVKKTGSRRAGKFLPNYRSSTGRAVVSFEYLGEGAIKEECV